MLRLLKFLFTGDWHKHEWETIAVDTGAGLCMMTGRETRVVRYTLRCKHCGKIKFVKG